MMIYTTEFLKRKQLFHIKLSLPVLTGPATVEMMFGGHNHTEQRFLVGNKAVDAEFMVDLSYISGLW